MDSRIKISDSLKEDILNLNYNKHFQYKTTAIIISFTYVAAIVIAWMTKQLNLRDYFQMTILGIFSIIVLTPSIYVLITSSKPLVKIPELIKSLK
ncbi:MAG: hypothetical protein ABIB47_04015 [Candidatus Woesearchaeota archaeon]